jgi:hypothetical protein
MRESPFWVCAFIQVSSDAPQAIFFKEELRVCLATVKPAVVRLQIAIGEALLGTKVFEGYLRLRHAELPRREARSRGARYRHSGCHSEING